MMYQNVLIKVFNVLLPYSLAIVGFSFAFECIYSGVYKSAEYSFLWIYLMLTGYMEYTVVLLLIMQ